MPYYFAPPRQPRDDNAQAVLVERARALIEREEAEHGPLSTDAQISLLLCRMPDVQDVQDAAEVLQVVDVLRELEEEDRRAGT